MSIVNAINRIKAAVEKFLGTGPTYNPISQQLRDIPGACDEWLASLAEPGIGGVLWVSSVNGNDATGARNTFRPFLTIGAALAAAEDFDTIIVAPGLYAEAVSWDFATPWADGVTLQALGRVFWVSPTFGQPSLAIEPATALESATLQQLTIKGQFEIQAVSEEPSATSILVAQPTNGENSQMFVVGLVLDGISFDSCTVSLSGLGYFELRDLVASPFNSLTGVEIFNCANGRIANCSSYTTGQVSINFNGADGVQNAVDGSTIYLTEVNGDVLSISGAPTVLVDRACTFNGGVDGLLLQNYENTLIPLDFAPEISFHGTAGGIGIVLAIDDAVGVLVPAVDLSDSLLADSAADISVTHTTGAPFDVGMNGLKVENLNDTVITTSSDLNTFLWGATYSQANLTATNGPTARNRHEIGVTTATVAGVTVNILPPWLSVNANDYVVLLDKLEVGDIFCPTVSRTDNDFVVNSVAVDVDFKAMVVEQ